MVPIGTSHLWWLRVQTHLSSASVHLSLLVGARSGIVAVFLPPHHPGKRLGPDGAVSAPKGSLRSGSSFFERLLQPFCLYQEVLGLGVVAANIKFLAFMSKIHHPEGSVCAFSDASVFRVLSSVHGVWQSFPILGSLLGFLHGSAGLQAGHGSGSEFFSTVLDSASAFSARLAHSGVLPRVDFLSLRMFLWLCNSRDSRRLGDVSACGASVVISSSESYWTLLVSGLLQPGNELQASLTWLPVSIMRGSTCFS